MRPDTGYYDDPDGFEDFAYQRSQALGKLLRAHRREERIRHENRYHDLNKDSMHREQWDWDDDNDSDLYVDDTCSDYNEDFTERY